MEMIMIRNKGRLVKRFAASVAWLLGVGGCAGPTPQENFDSLNEPFGSVSCASATADDVRTGSITALETPSTYNTCFRGYVVDLNNVSGPGSVRVAWDDSPPPSRACERTWGAAILYKKVSGAWVDQTGVLQDYGIWQSPTCFTPRIQTSSILTVGESYRIAVTMRDVYGGSTRAAQIDTILGGGHGGSGGGGGGFNGGSGP
jgi:hypothetical protein